MVDYIRGKKAYTKWDADSENVDIEYHEGPKASGTDGWLSGSKGKAIKILLVLLIFCMGLIIGYFIRRGVHEQLFQPVLINGGFPKAFEYRSDAAKLLQREIKAHDIKEFLMNLSLKPHLAGTASAKEIATTIKRHWEENGLENVRIDRYNVLLSYPSPTEPNLVSTVDANTTVANFTNIPTNSELRPYLAYSPSGMATGKLIYANYGRQKDFDFLEAQNISVNGSVVIMRLGKSHRGDKVRWAEERGAIAALLYPDPGDYVGKLEIFPAGIGLPGDAIVYGSLKTYPGDPETPRLPSIGTAYRPPFGTNLGLRTIPAQPISYNDARRLLSNMGGPKAPEEWTGDFNISYNLGPGFSGPNQTQDVRIQVYNQLQRRDIFNVIGVFQGQYEADEYVIIGCHHDTWTAGASDPGSGMAVMMELVQAFGVLKQDGWLPNRSLVFASWDAEEFGVIGSTEWVEDHAKELLDNAVAYINIDSAVTGNYTLHVLGSPLLKKALFVASRDVPISEDNGQIQSVYDLWRLHNVHNDSLYPKMDILGTGSDFVSFMAGYGIPSVHLQFINKDMDFDYPLYHTDYDIYNAVANYTDPSFNASTTLARLVATLALTLTDTLMLPYNCHDYVLAMEEGLNNLRDTYGDYLTKHGINLDILQKAITHFDRAANLHYAHFSQINGTNPQMAYHEYNQQLIQVERTFILPRGVQDSPIFRHAIFGPHPHNLHDGVVYPGIVDGILRAQQHDSPPALVEAIKVQVAEVVHVVRSAGTMLITPVVSHYNQDPFL